jgi:hypothetical protein
VAWWPEGLCYLFILYDEALSLLKQSTTSVWLFSSATSLAVFPSTFLAVLLAPLQGHEISFNSCSSLVYMKHESQIWLP